MPPRAHMQRWSAFGTRADGAREAKLALQGAGTKRTPGFHVYLTLPHFVPDNALEQVVYRRTGNRPCEPLRKQIASKTRAPFLKGSGRKTRGRRRGLGITSLDRDAARVATPRICARSQRRLWKPSQEVRRLQAEHISNSNLRPYPRRTRRQPSWIPYVGGGCSRCDFHLASVPARAGGAN